MEIEGLEVLCSVHHAIEHSHIYRYFRKLINWDYIPINFTQELLSLPGEIVHIIIWIVIENYFKDENISRADLHSARYSIIKSLKKKYIIEHIFGSLCLSCLEFSTSDHLVSFDFHHCEGPRFEENPYLHEKHRGKIRTVSELFDKDYSCSEIVKILEFEKGGYLCKNCHSVIQYTLKEQLLDVIYDNQQIAKNVLEDYINVKNKYKLLKDTGIVGDPLIKTLDISETLLKYLDAFYDISQDSKDITIQKLMKNLKLSVGAVSAFIRRNWAFINNFLNVKYKDPESFTSFKNIYILTEKGKNYIELISFIRGNFKVFFK
jgi:hypothetical protein